MANPGQLSSRDAADKASRSILVSLLVNLALALIKGLAGVIGHSYALIADAMESVMDLMKTLVVWGGLKIATTPPDECHPYGHGKAEPLAAIIISLSLIAGAAGLAIQSVREIQTPQQAPAAWTLIVLVGVVFTKEIMFRYVSAVGVEIESSAMKSNAWDNRSDALTSGAAFIGIAIAVLGGEGYESADDYAALFACAIIAYNGYRIFKPALDEVMDKSPSAEIEQEIRFVAEGVDRVLAVDSCYVRKMGFDLFVDLHIWVAAEMSVREGHDVAHKVKDAIRTSNPRVRDVLVHIEPAEHRDGRLVGPQWPR
jgi:cation diffusion facilitator family transporter